jgi:hypothetical protein
LISRGELRTIFFAETRLFAIADAAMHPDLPQTTLRPRPFQAILIGGLMCGVLDLVFAFVFYGLRYGSPPVRIMQSIAAGVLGGAAYEGGALTAALGVLFHFVVSFGAAATYWLASRVVPFLTRRAFLCGLVFGIAVFLFMNAIVLPLSAFPNAQFPPRFTVDSVLPVVAHMFLVGLPIALAVRRWGSPDKGQPRPAFPA